MFNHLLLEHIKSAFAQSLDVKKHRLQENSTTAIICCYCCYVVGAVERADGKVIVTYFRSHSNWTFMAANNIDGCGYCR